MALILSPDGTGVNYCFRVEPDGWDNAEFKAFIRSELRRRDWVQADLARRTGVPNGTRARWLNGSRRPSPESVLRIADALDADPDMLLALVGHREDSQPIDPDDPIGRIVALLKRIDLSDPARGDGLDAMLRAWADSDRRERASQAEGRSP